MGYINPPLEQRDGAHAILYVKKEGQGYFFDPNFGLIKCDPSKPDANTFMKLLSMYEPPNKLIPGEDENNRNYQVSVSKYKAAT